VIWLSGTGGGVGGVGVMNVTFDIVFHGNPFSKGILVHGYMRRCLPLQLITLYWSTAGCMRRKHNVCTPFAIILQQHAIKAFNFSFDSKYMSILGRRNMIAMSAQKHEQFDNDKPLEHRPLTTLKTPN
jgi:hypothetical protein